VNDLHRQPFLVQLGVISALLFTIFYAVKVTIRLERTKLELSDPEAALPPATVRYLKNVVEEQLTNTISEARSQIEHDVEGAAKELAISQLHDSSVAIAHGLGDTLRDSVERAKADLSASGQSSASNGAQSIEEWYEKLGTPYDLRFPDIEEYTEAQIQKITQLTWKSPKYLGPLDMEEVIDKRAKEIEAEWVAKGSPANEKPGYMIANIQKMPKWPVQIIKDMRDKETGVLGINAPFVDDYYLGEEERGIFWRLKNAGYIFVGISSYEFFPAENLNPVDNRHSRHNPADWAMYEAMDGWLHCQREPDKILPAGVPRAMISESDFVMYDRDDGGGRLIPRGLEKKYDFIYVNNGGVWNDYNRNWTLAKECIKIMCEMGLKVVTTRGEVNDPELAPYVNSGNIVVLKFQPWRDFLQVVESSRALFTPCISDASPRAVTEAMSLNVPVMMNTHIVGGWKYINDRTGVFFSDLSDVKASIQKILSPAFRAGLSPREWIMENYGKHKASLRLQAFLEIAVGKERLAEARRIRDSHPECHYWAPGACK